jgi:hypothetical protein
MSISTAGGVTGPSGGRAPWQDPDRATESIIDPASADTQIKAPGR